MVKLGVKNLMLRYPFAGRENDYDLGGYDDAQEANYDICWQSFVHDVREYVKQYSLTLFIYAGYAGGGAKPTVVGAAKREGDPNALLHWLDHNITPLTETHPSVMYMDAMGTTPEDNVYARWILLLRAAHELAGITRIGIEHPNLKLCLHWDDMPTASSWPNFESALQLGFWPKFTDPRCVLVGTGQPNHVTAIERVKAVLAAGGYAVASFRDWTQAEIESM